MQLNLVVWAKTNAGMGSLYRSQHELLPIFKKGKKPHVNNVKLGKDGRWRSNVWQYAGASSLGSDSRDGLKDHPTVKPVAMLEDALLDLTNREVILRLRGVTMCISLFSLRTKNFSAVFEPVLARRYPR